MSKISTHILNTAAGEPAAGVRVHLYCGQERLNSGETDADGRCPNLLPPNFISAAGTYTLLFEVSTVFPKCFYPRVTIEVRIDDPTAHYHVPLLISPYGYTTYRGS